MRVEPVAVVSLAEFTKLCAYCRVAHQFFHSPPPAETRYFNTAPVELASAKNGLPPREELPRYEMHVHVHMLAHPTCRPTDTHAHASSLKRTTENDLFRLLAVQLLPYIYSGARMGAFNNQRIKHRRNQARGICGMCEPRP